MGGGGGGGGTLALSPQFLRLPLSGISGSVPELKCNCREQTFREVDKRLLFHEDVTKLQL